MALCILVKEVATLAPGTILSLIAVSGAIAVSRQRRRPHKPHKDWQAYLEEKVVWLWALQTSLVRPWGLYQCLNFQGVYHQAKAGRACALPFFMNRVHPI